MLRSNGRFRRPDLWCKIGRRISQRRSARRDSNLAPKPSRRDRRHSVKSPPADPPLVPKRSASISCALDARLDSGVGESLPLPPRAARVMLATTTLNGQSRSQPHPEPAIANIVGIPCHQSLPCLDATESDHAARGNPLESNLGAVGITRENGQPTDSNLAQPSSVILLRARTPICASVF